MERMNRLKYTGIAVCVGLAVVLFGSGAYANTKQHEKEESEQESETITLDIARELLAGGAKKAEPIEIGENPATGKPIYFYPTGRYGAYISSNKVNVSVKSQPDLETAIELINNKKPSTRFKKGIKK